MGSVLAQQAHHPVREGAIERVVAGKHRHMVVIQQLTHLIERSPHLHPQGLALITARYDAPVVVAQHHHGTVVQFRVKHPFTRTIEIIAVSKAKELHYGSYFPLNIGAKRTVVFPPSFPSRKRSR